MDRNSETKNYRGINLLSIPGMVYRSIIINRVKKITECRESVEQEGVRKDGGCVDQISSVKKLIENTIAKRKLYAAFMDLEKGYDKVDRNAM